MKKVILILGILFILTGCSNTLKEPSRAMTKTVFPEYREYIKNDASLSDTQKQRRYRSLDVYEKLVED